MVQDGNGVFTPNSPRLIKRPDQLTAFGIHADDRKIMNGIVPNLGSNVSELLVSFNGGGGFLRPDSRHLRFTRREKFIFLSSLPTVLAHT